MQLRERLARLRSIAADADDNAAQNELESSRHEADVLLSAADRAIDRTLSSNSEAFLSECVQEGGQ